MEKWKFVPNVSIGSIFFGMSRNEVHNLFDISYKEFKKTKFSKNTTDDYGKFHIYYTADNKVDAVEIFEDIEISMDGEIIFPIKISDIESRLLGIIYEDGYYTHKEHSIGIEGNGVDAESILLGSKGYYD